MTQHVAPPQGRRIIVQEVHGFTRPERLALGQHLMSPDELAMLVFRRDLHRKRLQRRYDIKLFRERFHRDMAVFEAQLALLMQAEAQRQRSYHRRYDPAQPRDEIGRWTATGGGGSSQGEAVLDTITVYANPSEEDGVSGREGDPDTAEPSTTPDAIPPSQPNAADINVSSSLTNDELLALVSRYVSAAEPQLVARRNSAGLLGRALGKVLAAWQRQSRSPAA